MPFDGAGFLPERPEREGRAPSNTTISVLIVALAVGLLVMPISLVVFADIVRSLRGL